MARPLELEIVVAVCNTRFVHQLHGAVTALQLAGRVNITRVSLYPKCALETEFRALPPGWRVTKLPNYGRCDATYLHHILQHYEDLRDGVLFMKDSSVRQGVRLVELIESSMRQRTCAPDPPIPDHGFRREEGGHSPAIRDGPGPLRCSGEPTWRFTCAWRRQSCSCTSRQRALATHFRKRYSTDHEQNVTSALMGTFEAPFASLGAWAEQFNFDAATRHRMSQELWPVCYQASFVAPGAAITAVPQSVWAALHHSLVKREVDSVEEGHYMERLWGVLLDRPFENRSLGLQLLFQGRCPDVFFNIAESLCIALDTD
jgi:hypothetical protein